MLHIRTADVQLICLNNLAFIQLRDHLDIFLFTGTCHIGNDLRIKLRQPWQLPLHDDIHPWVLKTDGIQHAARCFRNTRCRISEAAVWCCTLDCYTSQKTQLIQLGKFTAKAEAATGWDDGVLQMKSR